MKPKTIQMKKFAFLVVLFASVFSISCSEDDSGSNPPQTVDDTDYFNLMIDGTTVPVDNWLAARSENNFEIVGQVADGRNIIFEFNAMNNLAQVTVTPDPEMNFTW